jgi:hypothetical protein
VRRSRRGRTVAPVTTLRLHVDDTVIYEGAEIAVPRVGDQIHHADQVVRVEAVVWDFSASGVVSVGLVLGDQPYTF